MPSQDDALEEAAYEDIPGITVRRHRLEDWVDKPFLERVLPGCLVRLSLGERASHSGGGTNKIYALAQVRLLAMCTRVMSGPSEACIGTRQQQTAKHLDRPRFHLVIVLPC